MEGTLEIIGWFAMGMMILYPIFWFIYAVIDHFKNRKD